MATEEDPPQVRPFAAFLQETNQGRTHTALSNHLHALVAEVLRTGKKGSMTLTISIEPDDVESRRLIVSETVNSKLPTPTAKNSIFWANGDGNVQRSDPAQMTFGDLRDASGFNPTQERHA